MLSIEQISRIYLQGVQEAYRQDMADKGMNASGGTAQAIRVQEQDGGGQVVGLKHMEQLIFGRRPGKFPGESLEQAISNMLKWINSKGIVPNDPNTSLRSLAFLFARKIARHGTDIFQGKRQGLSITNQLAEMNRKLSKDIGEAFKFKVVEELKKKRINGNP